MNDPFFPGKPLAEFKGSPLLARAIRAASTLGDVILISTYKDFGKVRDSLSGENYVSMLYEGDSQDPLLTMVLEVYEEIDALNFLIFPYDEPMLDPEQLKGKLKFDEDYIQVFVSDFFLLDDLLSPYTLKAVSDHSGRLLYLSRASIPGNIEGGISAKGVKKIISVFGLTKTMLDSIKEVDDIETPLSDIEQIEILRWLELGSKIYTIEIDHAGFPASAPAVLNTLHVRSRIIEKQVIRG